VPILIDFLARVAEKRDVAMNFFSQCNNDVEVLVQFAAVCY